MKSFLLAALCISACCATGYAQTEGASPDVCADGTVCFSLWAPTADDVELRLTPAPPAESVWRSALPFARSGKVELTQGDDSLWRCSIKNLPSEWYTYCFEVDDRRCLDPNNPNVVRDGADTLNWLAVAGGVADDYITQSVPHGTVLKVWYPSTMNGMTQRRMTVYLPAAYAADTATRFPVLYLLHGTGGDEEAWSGCGRAVQILDNLMADGRCCPMVVVMPNGDATMAAAPGYDSLRPEQQASTGVATQSMKGVIEHAFVDEVVHYVDQHYRTQADKAHRAIAGVSLGGLHAMFVALNYPSVFDYVGLFSAQTTNALTDKRIVGMKRVGATWQALKEDLPWVGRSSVDRKLSSLTAEGWSIYEDVDAKLQAQFDTPPQLYYIAVGRDDLIKKLNDDYRKRLDAGGYAYCYNETDGGHTWVNWRRYLVDFLPRLFR